MKVISFVTQKGGSGKTTLTLNFAVAALQKKGRVVIFDMDAQATAKKWYERRLDDSPQLVHLSAIDLEKAIDSAKAQKFDWVFIDTSGRDDATQAAAIHASDFCVIPCRPSAADLEATPLTVETLRRLEKPFVFVLTQTPPRSYRIKEAENGLRVLGNVCPVPIVMRNAFQDAQAAGLGVIEYEADGRAAKDVLEGWKWLVSRIKKEDYGKEKTNT
jgi:chromosome partitioning protein